MRVTVSEVCVCVFFNLILFGFAGTETLFLSDRARRAAPARGGVRSGSPSRCAENWQLLSEMCVRACGVAPGARRARGVRGRWREFH